MSVREDIIQVNQTNVGNQSISKEINRITNVDQSSANNAIVNPRPRQPSCTVIDIDDNSSADDDNQLTCALCLQAITLMQVEDMLIQRENANACVAIITIV
jgi:hypothetical protein